MVLRGVFTSIFSGHGITLAAIVVLLGLIAIKKIQKYLRQRQFMRENDCKPAPALAVRDVLFGLDEYKRRVKHLREHTFLDYLNQCFQRTGRTWSFNLFGYSLIQTIEPDNVKTVLSLKFHDFGLGAREKTLGKLLGRGIFTTDGVDWSHSRAMIRPNFARDQVGDLEAFERHIQTLFKLLPRDGTTVDLQEYFFLFTIDSATQFLFGSSTGTLEASLKQGPTGSSDVDFADAFNTAQHYVARIGRMGFLRHIYRDKAGEEACTRCHVFVDRFVEEAVRYRERVDSLEKKDSLAKDKYVFLHQLARKFKDKKRLRDELLNILLAGRDTTASLLSNMWHQIARRPDVFARLKAEVDETLHGRLPTYQELRNMKYLKYCMNESLRIHPVVPANGRRAYKDTCLPLGGGADGKSPVFVPAGTIVLYTTYSMHRLPEYYGANADEFKPERWENLRPGWEYLPFNGGPRICLGQQYALTEAGYVTVRLLQEYSRIETRDAEPWSENLTLTLCSKNGTLVSLTPA